MSESLNSIYNTLNNNFWIQFDQKFSLSFISVVVLCICAVLLSFIFSTKMNHEQLQPTIISIIVVICGLSFVGMAWYQNYQIRKPYRTMQINQKYQDDTTKVTQRLYNFEKENYNLSIVKNLNSSQLSNKQLSNIDNKLNEYKNKISYYQNQVNRLWQVQKMINEYSNKLYITNILYLRTKYPTYQISNKSFMFINANHNKIPFEINQNGTKANVIDNLDLWQANYYTNTQLQERFKKQFNIK